jgi:hypothetical protein
MKFHPYLFLSGLEDDAQTKSYFVGGEYRFMPQACQEKMPYAVQYLIDIA